MNLNANNIEKGMEVYGSDGEKIGSIAEVYSGTTTDNTAVGSTGDIVVEQVDVVDVAPAYTSGTGTVGTTAAAGAGMSSGTGAGNTVGGASPTGTTSTSGTGTQDFSGTTWNAGTATTGDIGGTGIATMTGGGYIHVQQGGILGIGSKDLYIPISDVQDVDPGNCVSLSITKQQADDNYQTKPDDLGTAHA